MGRARQQQHYHQQHGSLLDDEAVEGAYGDDGGNEGGADGGAVSGDDAARAVERGRTRLGRRFTDEEVTLLSGLVRHAHAAMGDWDEESMGRFVAVIASFGAMKPKAAFRFIGGACPDYVTAPFLAPLQETGVRLKPKHALQLVEAGARDREDLIAKIVDMVEHGVLDLSDPKTAMRVVATVDDAPLPVRVSLAKALGECTTTQEGFLGLLDRFLEGVAVKEEAPEFLRRVGEACHHLFFGEMRARFSREGAGDAGGEGEGGGDGSAVRRRAAELMESYPDLAPFLETAVPHAADDEEDADEDGNLKGFVCGDDDLGSVESEEEEEGGEGKRRRNRRRRQEEGGQGRIKKKTKTKKKKRRRVEERDKQEEGGGAEASGDAGGTGKQQKRRRVVVQEEESSSEEESSD